MKRTLRPRLIALIAAIVTLGLLVPVALADTPPGPNGPIAAGDETVLFLTRSSDDFFQWGANVENFDTRRNDCTKITFTGPDDLATVRATGDGDLGDVKDGWGELAPGEGTGEPCGRIDAPNQGVSIELSGLLDGYVMTRVDLDLELKFDAVATLTFLSDGVPLEPAWVRFAPQGPVTAHSGTAVEFTGDAETGDDGPDSSDGDNYRAYVEPLRDCTPDGGDTTYCPVPFDEIVVSASAGAVSLEGGADFESQNPGPRSFGAITGPPDGDYDPTNRDHRNTLSSQFGIQAVFDGTLDCGQPVMVGDGEDTPMGVITRLDYTEDGEVCVLKPYDLDATVTEEGENQIDFAPVGGQTARYSAELTSIPYDAENPVGQTLRYDPGDGYRVMEWCEIPTTPAEWEAGATGVLPAEEAWCIIGVSTEQAPEGQIQTTWSVIGEEDPGFRFG